MLRHIVLITTYILALIISIHDTTKGGLLMTNNRLHKLGIDIGSTTVKIAILDENDNLLFSDYEHYKCR